MPLWALSFGALVQGAEPKFKHQVVDDKIQIGYGLAIADVQGDGKPDILLADKNQIVWYENPTWQKHVIAENLTVKDHVCLAARDIDGDGKCEIAVGAEWNPGDTNNSGAVFYLIAPEDRRQKWEPVRLPADPTTHRMRWLKLGEGNFQLIVAPLHGKGNVQAKGVGVKLTAYERPKDPKGEWKQVVLADDYHATHNFDVIPGETKDREDVLLGGREGWKHLRFSDQHSWQIVSEVKIPEVGGKATGVGEIRLGRGVEASKNFVATIEPMHGNELAVYQKSAADDNAWARQSLSSVLVDGHALGCGDLLGQKQDQIVVGWRANSNKLARVGLELWKAKDAEGKEWESFVIDNNQMACEDLMIADLNADGKPEIIAAGRRTQNVKIYWNEN